MENFCEKWTIIDTRYWEMEGFEKNRCPMQQNIFITKMRAENVKFLDDLDVQRRGVISNSVTISNLGWERL